MSKFNEVLKEYGVSHYTELPKDIREFVEKIYVDECRYGVETAEEFRKFAEAKRIEENNKEYLRKEEEKCQARHERLRYCFY